MDGKHNPSKTACEHQHMVQTITRARRTSSYRATGVASLINFSPSQRIPAVIPLPQVVVTRRWPSRINRAYPAPTTSSSFRRSSFGGRKVVNVAPEWWPEFFCRNALNGRENEYGICPEGSPLGSGSAPVYLNTSQIGFARAAIWFIPPMSTGIKYYLCKGV